MPIDIVAISCLDAFECRAVYNANGNNGFPSIPQILVSHDGGLSWADPIIPPLPSNAFDWDSVQMAGLFAITCINQQCIAVGNYKADVQSKESDRRVQASRPYAVISRDGGLSWTNPTSPPLPADELSSKSHDVRLEHISCNTFECRATGRYKTETGTKNKPFSVITHDGGLSWALVAN